MPTMETFVSEANCQDILLTMYDREPMRELHSLAQEQDDPTLMIEAYHALAGTLYWLGDFELAREYAMRTVQIWRSGNVQPHTEDAYTPAVGCLCYQVLS